MTLSYDADRTNLSRLLPLHPHWTQQQLADALGRSRAWVKKWGVSLARGGGGRSGAGRGLPRSLACTQASARQDA